MPRVHRAHVRTPPNRYHFFHKLCYKEFVERTCGRLRVASQVCNGRECLRNCPMHKRVYDADDAEANRQGKLHESRRGIHPDDAKVVLKRNGVTSPVKK